MGDKVYVIVVISIRREFNDFATRTRTRYMERYLDRVQHPILGKFAEKMCRSNFNTLTSVSAYLLIGNPGQITILQLI